MRALLRARAERDDARVERDHLILENRKLVAMLFMKEVQVGEVVRCGS